MTDEGYQRGPSRGQRIIAWPFVLVAVLIALGAAGLTVADVILRYAASAPIRGMPEIAQLIVAGVFAVGLPAAAILGIRSGGPTYPPPAERWWAALHTALLFLIEVVLLAGLGLLLLADAFRRIDAGERSLDLAVPLGVIELGVGAGVLAAALCVLIAGSIRLVRGQ